MGIVAIIPAGGIGKRMNSQKPKQFLTLNNEPIILITIRALAETGLVSKIIIPTVDLVYTRKIIKMAHPDLDIQICKGGKTRQESVHNGLDYLKETDWNPDYILIHDAVRALVRKDTIEKVIAKAQETGAAIVARPILDTIKLAYKEGEDIIIKKNIPRDHMWFTQTPQVFKADLLIEAYNKAREDHFTGTDSASLVERLNHPICIVEGYPSNIKITTPEDLDLAKMYLDSRV
ncbi:MAG: 2-C-methyl-D-erythritol 4-phosphate cytidylyltransferase [Cyanobacteria bacterium]|nr:2-C-methyl-D-erythritol 4-phosphate cytidylyltransferase [Cyanobacteriota bacterium]MDA1020073.1 2-C-methyl-D-erythritol 4-phosphate cytidylyltransferase [Cyanobacteriota bacterium]